MQDTERFAEATELIHSIVLFHRATLETDSLGNAGLSASLFRLTTSISRLQRIEDSCAVRREAIHVYRRAYKIHPEKYQLDFARALFGLGNDLRLLGEIENACLVSQECAVTLHKLWELDSSGYHDDLVSVLYKLHTDLIALKRHDEAAAVGDDWVAICKQTHDTSPCNYCSGFPTISSVTEQCSNDSSSSSTVLEPLELGQVPR